MRSLIIYLQKGKLINLLKLLLYKSLIRLRSSIWRVRDRFLTSYSPSSLSIENLFLDGIREFLPGVIRNNNIEQIKELSHLFLQHCFDLLGSGWVKVNYGMKCRGMHGYFYPMSYPVMFDLNGNWLKSRINSSNWKESKRIWSLINDPVYSPIDWQLDFKSGYRWKETVWYKDIRYGHRPGVDIKIPWELSRMQHLPQLAWAYGLASQGEVGFEAPEIYLKEFRNQILDFIALNPPRWGVNWASSMDVAIRAVNWLISYDLFCNFGATLDKEFVEVFSQSIYEHGLHIINNLEWSPAFRNNHYLANVIGLLYIASYLPCNSQTNYWLVYATRELIEEVEYQFNPDGSNFEASTCYHRLSAEMVVYATALIAGLPKAKKRIIDDLGNLPVWHPVFLKGKLKPINGEQTQSLENSIPKKHLEKLEKMAEFTIHLTKPDGSIHQIGDNDSGRFVKLFPTMKSMKLQEVKLNFKNLIDYDEYLDNDKYWVEDFLDHRHLIAAIQGLFKRDDFAEFLGDDWKNETLLIQLFSKNFCARPSTIANRRKQDIVGDYEIWLNYRKYFKTSDSLTTVTKFILPDDLTKYLETIAFADFGVYIFRAPNFYMAIRCGSVGQRGKGGHAHNDQLSLELYAGDCLQIIDPGSYIYTPLPEIRNRYRSVKAHFAPRFGDEEPGDIKKGVFILGGNPKPKVYYFGPNGFLGSHEGFGFPVFRHVQINSSELIITDFSMENSIRSSRPADLLFSPAYGVIINSPIYKIGIPL